MRAVALVAVPALVGALLLCGAAVAAEPSLKSCNQAADAKHLTGKERAAFVKECLAGKPH